MHCWLILRVTAEITHSQKPINIMGWVGGWMKKQGWEEWIGRGREDKKEKWRGGADICGWEEKAGKRAKKMRDDRKEAVTELERGWKGRSMVKRGNNQISIKSIMGCNRVEEGSSARNGMDKKILNIWRVYGPIWKVSKIIFMWKEMWSHFVWQVCTSVNKLIFESTEKSYWEIENCGFTAKQRLISYKSTGSV